MIQCEASFIHSFNQRFI